MRVLSSENNSSGQQNIGFDQAKFEETLVARRLLWITLVEYTAHRWAEFFVGTVNAANPAARTTLAAR